MRARSGRRLPHDPVPRAGSCRRGRERMIRRESRRRFVHPGHHYRSGSRLRPLACARVRRPRAGRCPVQSVCRAVRTILAESGGPAAASRSNTQLFGARLAEGGAVPPLQPKACARRARRGSDGQDAAGPRSTAGLSRRNFRRRYPTWIRSNACVESAIGLSRDSHTNREAV